MARSHKIYRRPIKHKRIGFRAMDEVLTRIEAIGWSLRDLDLQSGTVATFGIMDGAGLGSILTLWHEP